MPLLELLQTEHVASYLTLTFLEIVLAGDNLVLIAILAGRLPEHQRPLARRIGLIAAVSTRLLLLFSLFWISHLETALKVPGFPALTVTPTAGRSPTCGRCRRRNRAGRGQTGRGLPQCRRARDARPVPA